MPQQKKINHTFNTWTKNRTEEGPPDDTHYSITRDRGTVQAEALLKATARTPSGHMLTPPPLPVRR